MAALLTVASLVLYDFNFMFRLGYLLLLINTESEMGKIFSVA